MTESDRRFVTRSISRKKLFLGLSLAGIVAGLGLGVYYALQWSTGRIMADSAITGGVILILVLLNARQNLRQYRYARILETLSKAGSPPRQMNP